MDIVVHGGAGDTGSGSPQRQAVLDEAVSAATNAGTPVDAVERAIRRLETSPRFNAGRGGAVQSDGTIRTDAGIMTCDRSTGAACGMPGVEHAISVARSVMEETPHVMLAGEPAVRFAAASGIETGVDLWSDRRRRQWADCEPPTGDVGAQLEWIRSRFGGFDTVGAVATDGETIAAATSTGGRWLALAGRVGDVPQVGGGFYATPAGGASTTGAGEEIAKEALARSAVEQLGGGSPPQTVAESVIERFHERTGSDAGIIICDDSGNVGTAATTDAMQTSHASRS